MSVLSDPSQSLLWWAEQQREGIVQSTIPTINQRFPPTHTRMVSPRGGTADGSLRPPGTALSYISLGVLYEPV